MLTRRASGRATRGALVVAIACAFGCSTGGEDPLPSGPEGGGVAHAGAEPVRGLTVTAWGAGLVTSSPEGIACGHGGACSFAFAAGETVSLTATPDAGWAFAGWSGSCAGTGGCEVLLSSPVTVGAIFSEAGPGAITLHGRVTYDFVPAVYDPSRRIGTLDFASAAVRPVRAAVVRARAGSTLLATALTDADGRYALTFAPGAASAIAIEALARTVSPSIQVEDNTDGDAVWAVGVEGLPPVSAERNLHATHGWSGSRYDAAARIAAPFAILDSAYTAATGFLAARPVLFPPLRVNWSPNNAPSTTYSPSTGAIVTSHYTSGDGEIYVLGKDGVDADEFDAHVVVHEWGHYFESRLSRSDSPGGPHAAGDVLDPRLAFGEAYGSALAAMLLPEPIYVDTYWSSGKLRAFGFSAESAYSDDPRPGPFSEMSVYRLLHDLWDAGDGEPWDRVALGLGPIHDVLVGPQRTTPALTTIASFVAALKAHPDVAGTIAEVDALLAHYAIGALSDEWGTGDAALAGTYLHTSPLPHSATVTLAGGPDAHNKRQAVQYFAVTGTGRRVVVTSTCTSDVALVAYQAGRPVAYGRTASPTDRIEFATTAGVPYVVVLTGYEPTVVTYSANVRVESP